MTIEYVQRAVVSVESRKFHTIVTSTQQAEALEAVCSREFAEHSCPAENAPGMDEMRVFNETLEEIILKNGTSRSDQSFVSSSIRAVFEPPLFPTGIAGFNGARFQLVQADPVAEPYH